MTRVRLLAATLLACSVASLSGCGVVRNPFLVMSSDSPMPFFGGEIAFPPKFGKDR